MLVYNLGLIQPGEDVTELGVVDYHAVVEVHGDHLVGYGMQAFLIFQALLMVLDEFVEAAALGGVEGSAARLHGFYLGAEVVDVPQQVIDTDVLNRVGGHAVHVGDDLECPFLA